MAWWNAKNPAARIHSGGGDFITPEGRRRLSLSRRGENNPVNNPGVKERISKSLRAYSTPVQAKRWREKKHLAVLREIDSVAYKEEISRRIAKGQKKAWRNKEVRKRRVDSLVAAWDRDYEWRVAEVANNPETVAKISAFMKKRGPVAYPRGPKVVLYNGIQGRIKMRSKSEVEYAKMLDEKGIQWLYECTTFVMARRSWTPDFYLPERKMFVEIKGWYLPDVKKKIEKIQKHYASTKILVMSSERLVA